MSEVMPHTFFLDYAKQRAREGAGLAMTSTCVRQGERILIVAKRERFPRIKEQLVARLGDMTLLKETADTMEWGNGARVVLCDPLEQMEHEQEAPQANRSTAMNCAECGYVLDTCENCGAKLCD